MNEPIGYGLDSWLPVLRGGEAPARQFDAADPRTPERLKETWGRLPQGGRIVLVAQAGVGSRPDLAQHESQLAQEGHVERFIDFHDAAQDQVLLPIQDGAAFRGGLPLLQRGDRTGRGGPGLLRTASPLSVARRTGRPEIAVWTKGPAPEPTADLAVLPVAGSVAASPGQFDHHKKSVIRALDRRGAARAILKVGTSNRSDDAVRREAAALETLKEHGLQLGPALLASGEREGHAWLAEEVLPGRRTDPALLPMHAQFLIELGEASREEGPLEDNQFFVEASTALDEMKPEQDPDWYAEYTALRSALVHTSDDALVPTAMAHGDFTPWNLFAHKGRLRSFDWEHFAGRAPALHDLVHFHVMTGVLVHEKTGERVFDELNAFFSGPAAPVVAASGVGAEDILRLVGLHVLYVGVTSERLERRTPTASAAAGKLRHARRALCRRLAGLLADRTLPIWTRVDIPGPRKAA